MILEAVREAADGQIAVLAKTNMADGVPGGLWLDESLAFARLLEADGHLDALELTGGSSLLDPMYLFRGNIPAAEMAATQKPIIKLGMKMFGWAVFKKYPYTPLYFLDYARQFRRALSMPLVLLGGITDLDAMNTAMNEGSSTWRWRGRCCANRASSIGCRPTRRPGRRASTAICARRASSPEPGARWSRARSRCGADPAIPAGSARWDYSRPIARRPVRPCPYFGGCGRGPRIRERVGAAPYSIRQSHAIDLRGDEPSAALLRFGEGRAFCAPGVLPHHP